MLGRARAAHSKRGSKAEAWQMCVWVSQVHGREQQFRCVMFRAVAHVPCRPNHNEETAALQKYQHVPPHSSCSQKDSVSIMPACQIHSALHRTHPYTQLCSYTHTREAVAGPACSSSAAVDSLADANTASLSIKGCTACMWECSCEAWLLAAAASCSWV
jgi:hypothetical protein